jgi:arabinose-5-phosphate isomerase
MTTIIDKHNKLLGIFTDGDLRRTLDRGENLQNICISDVMTRNSKTIAPNLLAAEGLRMMQEFKITSLVVTDDQQQLVGIVHLHDLLRAGVI